MLPIQLDANILLALIFVNCALIAQADHWVYLPEEANGVVKGEELWPGQCRNGQKQSPIDLAKDASVIGRYSPLVFKNYDKLLKNATIRNTGHSLQIDIPKDQELSITGGGLPGAYKMDQMHFHWKSEHTIDKERFGLELHIVSHAQQYENFTVAVQNKKGVAVLGVLFLVAGEINPVLRNILDSAESVKDAAGESNYIKMPFSPMELLPTNRKAYFRYEGSLTTPSCDEAVIWTVFESSVPFASEQIERFQQVKDADGALLRNNFRQLQRLNSRPLIYVRGGDHFNVLYSAALELRMPMLLVGAIIMLQTLRFKFVLF